MQNAIQATKQHCAFCFQVLLSHFKKEDMPQLPENLPKCNVPVFVTLHVFDDQLRGCIGTFSPGPVEKVLTKFTLSSAFQDSRFPPLQQKELDNLDIGVSFLINFEKGKKWNQWEVGKHGIIIDFTDEKGRDYGATFLPEVAQEQEWDIETTLQHLIMKAGYRKDPRAVFEKIELTTYESSKAKLTYKEFMEKKY